MKLGVVSDSDFAEALEKLTSGRIEQMKEKGRATGDKEVPTEVRNLVGASALEHGSKATKILSDFIGISDSSVSAYKNGATSTTNYHTPDAKLKDHLTRTRERISRKAGNKLLTALEHMTEDKLKEASAPELASVAKSMGAVIRDMAPPPEAVSNSGGPTFVLYSPKIANEDKFPIIDLSDESK